MTHWSPVCHTIPLTPIVFSAKYSKRLRCALYSKFQQYCLLSSCMQWAKNFWSDKRVLKFLLHSPTLTLEFVRKLVYILFNIKASDTILVHCTGFGKTNILGQFHWKMHIRFLDITAEIYQPYENLLRRICRLKFLHSYF